MRDLGGEPRASGKNSGSMFALHTTSPSYLRAEALALHCRLAPTVAPSDAIGRQPEQSAVLPTFAGTQTFEHQRISPRTLFHLSSLQWRASPIQLICAGGMGCHGVSSKRLQPSPS